MNNKKISISEKLKEVSIEILIIVFAVTLSIKLHEWSEHSHQQKEVKEFLTDLREDLADDIETMNVIKDQMTKTSEDKTYVMNFTEQKFDSIRLTKDSLIFKQEFEMKIPTSGITRNNLSGNYEGFKSSGKIGNIENKKIKKLMLQYYQQLIPFMSDAEKYYNLNLTNTGDVIAELKGLGKKGKEIIFNPKFQFFFNVTLSQSVSMKDSYQDIINLAKELDAEIAKELKS